MRKKIPYGKAVVFVIGIILLALLWEGGGKKGFAFSSYGLYTVLTGSMSPTFNAGSVIITKKTEADALQAGDILTFAASGDDTLVTHRIVEVNYDGADYSYTTKGDANNINDLTPVPYEYTVGRVIFWVNGLGNVLLFIRTPRGLALVLIYILAFILILHLIDMLREHPGESRKGIGKARGNKMKKRRANAGEGDGRSVYTNDGVVIPRKHLTCGNDGSCVTEQGVHIINKPPAVRQRM